MQAVKTAVVGASGFVGRHLWESYQKDFPDCVGTSHSKAGPGLTSFDIRTPELSALRLEETGHQAVVIASAMPNVAYCERERESAFAVNVTGTLELIRQMGRTSLSVVFISSDYVFDGTSGQYDDDASTNPTTEYGRQKAIVEREIPSLIKSYLIVRLSKVYGLVKNDNTLLDEMARTLSEGRRFQAATDQIFCPTYVGDVVRAMQNLQQLRISAKVNLCSPERWSRFDIARALGNAMNADPSQIDGILLHSIPSMKGRPLDSSMLCSRLTAETGVSFLPLRDAIRHVASLWSSEHAGVGSTKGDES